MNLYRHILIATDFSDHASAVGQRGLDLSQRYGSELSLLHVVESLPIVDSTYGPVMPFEIDLTEQMVEAAQKRMAKQGELLGVRDDCRLIELGSPKLEIVRVAAERGVDLIVIGSHGRHGVKLLLGSVAASVMHHAGRDVLAVRLVGSS
jgi:universal stress protein A